MIRCNTIHTEPVSIKTKLTLTVKNKPINMKGLRYSIHGHCYLVTMYLGTHSLPTDATDINYKHTNKFIVKLRRSRSNLAGDLFSNRFIYKNVY